MNVLTCNVRSSGKYERWHDGDQNHERSVVVLDDFRKFKGIQLIVEYNIENEEGILIQGKGNCCSKLKGGKLKTKKLLKIARLLDEQKPSVQSAEQV